MSDEFFDEHANDDGYDDFDYNNSSSGYKAEDVGDEGRRLRDKALKKVLREAWKNLHHERFHRFLMEHWNEEFICEDYRKWWFDRGYEKPHHPASWGAVWASFSLDCKKRSALIEQTGSHIQSYNFPESHAKPALLWRRKV